MKIKVSEQSDEYFVSYKAGEVQHFIWILRYQKLHKSGQTLHQIEGKITGIRKI